MSRQPPEQQRPPAQRLRIRYAKRGRLRFASHRDFARAFERALRRAGVPMAYSSGFSPHPRISYANAAPTGAASEAEYLEIALAEVREPPEVRAALDTSLPEGLDVLEVVPAEGVPLPERLTGSRWSIRLTGIDPSVIAHAAQAFLDSTEVLVDRMMKSGLRTFDARESVKALVPEGDGFELVLAHGTPLVRPDDVLQALHRVWPAFVVDTPARFTRLEQGTLTDARIADPLT